MYLFLEWILQIKIIRINKMPEKIKSMIEECQEKLEKYSKKPIEYVMCIRLEAQIDILKVLLAESLRIDLSK